LSGYHADLDAITDAAGVLRAAADSLSAVAANLDTGLCVGIGPGRLGAVAAGVTEDAREALDSARRAVVEDAGLADAAARGYADADWAAAERLAGRAGEPG
jgi:hypothetical protein